ncbi:hypothetical protein LTR53_010577 [Teratosphaeriaceae sp. CCFEE 6253]|nr:hypothetical protein LTR53_010577 [Teratosphaeriaceae sp. CCFEE 6253]
MGGKKEITWDVANDRKLLLMILELSNVKPDYEKLAKGMATDDCKPSASGIASRLSKLKGMAKKATGEEGDSPSKSRKRSAPVSAKGNGNNRAASGASDLSGNHGDQQDDEEIIPDAAPKKQRIEGIKKEAAEEDCFD